jgi:hypothetical protein
LPELAKVRGYIGECPVAESHIGEDPASRATERGNAHAISCGKRTRSCLDLFVDLCKTETFGTLIALLSLGQTLEFSKPYGQNFLEPWAFAAPLDTVLWFCILRRCVPKNKLVCEGSFFTIEWYRIVRQGSG